MMNPMVLLSLQGIIQGNPLFAYIFITYMKVLNHAPYAKANKKKPILQIRSGAKISPRDTKIPCLSFADDCLLFCKENSAT